MRGKPLFYLSLYRVEMIVYLLRRYRETAQLSSAFAGISALSPLCSQRPAMKLSPHRVKHKLILSLFTGIWPSSPPFPASFATAAMIMKTSQAATLPLLSLVFLYAEPILSFISIHNTLCLHRKNDRSTDKTAYSLILYYYITIFGTVSITVLQNVIYL